MRKYYFYLSLTCILIRQIQNIERLVDTVEDLTKRIRSMQVKVNEQKETEAKKKDAATPPKGPSPAPAAAAAAAAASKGNGAARKASGEPLEEEDEMGRLWRQLRLQVRLDVDEAGDAYVIQVRDCPGYFDLIFPV